MLATVHSSKILTRIFTCNTAQNSTQKDFNPQEFEAYKDTLVSEIDTLITNVIDDQEPETYL